MVAGEPAVTTAGDGLSSTRGHPLAFLPAVDAEACARMMRAHAQVLEREAAVEKAHKDAESKQPDAKASGAAALRAAREELAAARMVAAETARVVLDGMAGFLDSDTHDLALMRGELLRTTVISGKDAKVSEAVDALLRDEGLIREVMEAGGARGGRIHEAMGIYRKLLEKHPRAKEPGIFHRLALAIALEHAVPIPQLHAADRKNAPEFVDPTARFEHYQSAHLRGELVEGFGDLGVWELRMVVNGDAPEEIMAWGREMLRNYRPDHLFQPDEGWRYSILVKTDVLYGSQDVAKDLPSLHPYQNMLMNGGVCGRRAFFGRFLLRSFGVPVWGVTQKAHAAIGRWTSHGWTVNLGASFDWSWWDKGDVPRSGADFLLESRARATGEDYRRVLRCQWISGLSGEQPFNHRKRIPGGFWSAAAHHAAIELAARAKSPTLAPLGEEVAESNGSSAPDVPVKTRIDDADKISTVDAAGRVRVPAVAFRRSVGAIMASPGFGGGTRIHLARDLKADQEVEYRVDVPKAGGYQLTATVVTVQNGQRLLVGTGDGKATHDLPVPFTLGQWQSTPPVVLDLEAGENRIRFVKKAPSRGITIRDIVLTPVAAGATAPVPSAGPDAMAKRIKVFLLMGQSNMVGLGRIGGPDGSLEFAVREKKRYAYLGDGPGAWRDIGKVRYVRVMNGRGGGRQVINNGPLNVKDCRTIGPEFGIGHVLGQAMDEPVLLLKSCIGNRSLGWDLLPPGSGRFVEGGMVYAGYHDPRDFWPVDPALGAATAPPMPWLDKKGNPIAWFGGKQYDDDVANARAVLAEPGRYFPGAAGFEVAGFFFWQGEKDTESPALAARYERNLVAFIKRLRVDFQCPEAGFVLGTLGESVKGSGGNGGLVLNAQLAVDGTTGKYPEFRGNVATVYTHPISKGGSGNSHYNGNAETYMDVGEAMGKAMLGLDGR